MINLIKDKTYKVVDNKIIFSNIPEEELFIAGITPQFAKDALQSTAGNRKIVKHQVEDLKKAIDEKNWVVGDSCALFEQVKQEDSGLSLRNAHHRLIAIAEKGEEYPDMILPLAIRVTNDPKDILFADQNKPRTLQDTGAFVNNPITIREQQVLKAFIGGGYTSRQMGFDVRNFHMLELWNKYKECIKETIGFLSREGADAKVTAAFARALYNKVDINVLRRYAYYINNQTWPKDINGQYPNYDGDESIVTLKNWLNKGIKNKTTNYALTEEIFYKTQAALYKAINHKNSKSIKTTKTKIDFFPIEEQKFSKKEKNNIFSYLNILSENWKDKTTIKPKMLAEQIQKHFKNDAFVLGRNTKKLAGEIAKLFKKKPVVALKCGKIAPTNPYASKQFKYIYFKNDENDELVEKLFKLN